MVDIELLLLLQNRFALRIETEVDIRLDLVRQRHELVTLLRRQRFHLRQTTLGNDQRQRTNLFVCKQDVGVRSSGFANFPDPRAGFDVLGGEPAEAAANV